MNIPDRWIAKLDMLPPKDFKTLVMAILRDESEPEITLKYQPIANDIYIDIRRLKRDSEYQKKRRSKSDCQTTVRRLSDKKRKEKRLPLVPPLLFPRTPLLTPPIIPLLKRKEKKH